MSEATDPERGAAARPTLDPQVRNATEIAVRLGALLLLVVWCLHIISPFIGIVVWAFIIAVAAAGPQERVAAALGGRNGLAATFFVLLGLVAIILPAVMLSETLVRGAAGFAAQVQAGEVALPKPPASVADLPIVGEKLYAAWNDASENLRAALQQLRPQLETVSQWLLSAAGSAGVALLHFVAALLIAGVLLAKSQGRDEAVRRFAARLSGDRGLELATLAEATIRSVVQGIVGVALIQSILAGLGFLAVGLPAAGLWALLVLVSAVVQLPVAVVMVAPVLIVLASESTGVAAAFLVWNLLVSLVDNVLKPLFFSRGAQVPTIVIFIGSIGGMLAMGIIGLFVGAVVLALGHQILMAWLADDSLEAGETSRTESAS